MNTSKSQTNQQNQQQNNHQQIVTDNDIWLENLRKNEEQRRRNSRWFSMQPGEKTVLEFLPEFGPVWKDFDGDGQAETLRYEYKVIDVNNRQDGPKPWDVSKTWSIEIDYHLKQGHYILKVERTGSGMKTKYHFTPVDTPNAAAATAIAASSS